MYGEAVTALPLNGGAYNVLCVDIYFHIFFWLFVYSRYLFIMTFFRCTFFIICCLSSELIFLTFFSCWLLLFFCCCCCCCYYCCYYCYCYCCLYYILFQIKHHVQVSSGLGGVFNDFIICGHRGSLSIVCLVSHYLFSLLLFFCFCGFDQGQHDIFLPITYLMGLPVFQSSTLNTSYLFLNSANV